MSEYREKNEGGLPDDEYRLKCWQGRIALSKEYQNRYGNTNGRWDTNVKAMAGDFNSKNELGEEAIDVNKVYSATRTVLPPLWLRTPYITVKPNSARYENKNGTFDNVYRAKVTEIELNYWFRELEIRKTMKQCILDSECTNHGYLYVGYTKTKKDLQNDEGDSTEFMPTIKPKQPFVRRISPKNLLVPPGYWLLEEMPWVGIVWCRPLEDVRAKYGEAATKDLAPTKSWGDSYENRSKIPSELASYLDDDDAKLVEVVEIWDKMTRKIYTLAVGHDKFLQDGKAWPVKVEGFPLVDLSPVQVSDEYYATPPLGYYLPQNKELNAARTAQRKRHNRSKSVIFVAGTAGDEIKEAYQNANDGEIISLPNVEDMGKIMQVVPPLPPDANIAIYEATINRDIQETTIGAEQAGSGDPNIDSATASANVEKWTQVRASDRADQVASAYIDTARKLWMILKQFPDQKRTQMIAGGNAGQSETVQYTLADLEGEFSFELDVSGMLAENPQTRSVQAVNLYNLMRQDPLVDPNALILDVFESLNKTNPERYMLTLREPDEEHQMMLQGLPVEAHERDDHQTHIKSHMIQIQVWMQLLNRIGDLGEGAQKLKMAGALALSHLNGHMMEAQKIAAATGGKAGSAIAENTLRNNMAVSRGTETQAEMTGQPLLGAG